jgi:hypothetical protein
MFQPDARALVERMRRDEPDMRVMEPEAHDPRDPHLVVVEVEGTAVRFASARQWETWRRWHHAGLPNGLYGELRRDLFVLQRLRPLDSEAVLNAVMDGAAIPELPAQG